MYILGLDETGNTVNFSKRKQKIQRNEKISENEKYFIIVIIVMKEEEYNNFQLMMDKFKNKVKHLNIKQIHASELFANKKYRKSQEINFIFSGIEKIISELNFRFYYSIVDVEKHVKKYVNPFDPYQISIKRIVERIKKDISSSEIKVIVEGRNKNDDLLSKKTIFDEFWKWNIYLKNLNIDFVCKKNKNYNSIIEITDFIAYILRQKLIKKSYLFEKNRGNYFSDKWINNILESKMFHNKNGYDILEV